MNTLIAYAESDIRFGEDLKDGLTPFLVALKEFNAFRFSSSLGGYTYRGIGEAIPVLIFLGGQEMGEIYQTPYSQENFPRQGIIKYANPGILSLVTMSMQGFLDFRDAKEINLP